MPICLPKNDDILIRKNNTAIMAGWSLSQISSLNNNLLQINLQLFYCKKYPTEFNTLQKHNSYVNLFKNNMFIFKVNEFKYSATN